VYSVKESQWYTPIAIALGVEDEVRGKKYWNTKQDAMKVVTK
jgi:hypothetical protein